MRGTWYKVDFDGKISEIKFDNNSFEDGTKSELHLQSSNYAKKIVQKDNSEFSSKEKDADKRFSAVFKQDAGGLNGIDIRGWLQVNGGSMYYAPYKLKGKNVILNGMTQNYPSIRQVYWSSKELANKYKDIHFDEIDDLNEKMHV